MSTMSPIAGQVLLLKREPDNCAHKYTIAMDCVVDPVPYKLAKKYKFHCFELCISFHIVLHLGSLEVMFISVKTEVFPCTVFNGCGFM